MVRQGRTREIEELAAEMLQIFEVAEVHREAIAAWVLFQEAANQHRITVAMIEKVARDLRQLGSAGSR